MFVGKDTKFKGAGKDKSDGKKGEPTKYKKRSCPIRCEKGLHTNGSLYFCPTFRGKSKEEKKSLQKKTRVCITCLGKVPSQHTCSVGACRNCGAQHNILLCSKTEGEEAVLEAREEDYDPSSSEDEETYRNNSLDAAFVASKSEPIMTSTPDKSKKGRGSKEKIHISIISKC